MKKLRLWLLSPVTLWPVNLEVLGHRLIDSLKTGKLPDHATVLALEILTDPPSENTWDAVGGHEHNVQRGIYEHLVHAEHKFNHKEQELGYCKELLVEWKQITNIFDVKKYQDRKGIIRRQLIPERNLRVKGWDIDWKQEEDRFQIVFDTFCHRWNLYGMERNKPLLLKMTVNLTPYGTQIFIPAYWNFDPKRDLKWGSIAALHRARGVVRQGPKLGRNRIERLDDAVQAKQLMQEAKKAGLRGERRDDWVMKQMGWDVRTDSSRLRRLLKLLKNSPV